MLASMKEAQKWVREAEFPPGSGRTHHCPSPANPWLWLCPGKEQSGAEGWQREREHKNHPKKSLAGSWCHPKHGNRAAEGSWTSRYSQKNRQCILKTPPEANHLTLERTKVRRAWAAFNSSTVIVENIRKMPQMGWRRSSPERHSGKLHKEYDGKKKKHIHVCTYIYICM